MSYGEYKFGDFAKLYDVGGPSDELVGFAQGFAQGFVPAYQAGIKAQREKDLALAKLDKAAELDAQKAKNDANTAYKENMDKAKQIVSTLSLPEDVSENDAVMLAFGMLDGGISDNTVFTQLQKAIEDNTLTYDEPAQEEPTTPPAANTPAAPASNQTPLEIEMNEAFGDQSSVVDPEPASTLISEAPTTEDGSYETASLGTGWAEDYVKRQEDRVNAASETQVAALDTQTDVTNPDGLGGGSESVSDVILADSDGVTTESEQVAATQRTLRINPLAKEKAADEIDLSKIDTYAKALAAVTVLTGSGKDDDLNRAKFLLKQFTKTPDIGSMDLQAIDAFLNNTRKGVIIPEYSNIDPEILTNLRIKAQGYKEDLQNSALPSLSETDPEVLRGVQADVLANRIKVSPTYASKLATRIKALDDLAEAEKIENFVFDEKYVEKTFFLARKTIYAKNLTDTEKAAEWKLWQDTEGKELQAILRVGDKPDKPQEINSLEEAAIVELMASEAYQDADEAGRLDLIEGTKRFLEKTEEGSLTQAKYANMVANYTLMLSSENADEVKEAQTWFSTISPALEAGLKAGAVATTRPGDPEKFQIRYTTKDGKTLRAEATKVEGGYRLDDGTVVAPDKTLFVRSTENQGYINDQLSRTRTERNKQRENMVSLVDLTQQAYALEQIAINDPVVLTLVGGGTTVVEAARTEAKALLTVITNASQEAFQDSLKDPAKASNRIEQALNKFIESNGITGETAANYRKFSAKLTRFVFAAGKALGQEGNGFSNQDYKNILNSLQAGNGIGAFVENLRSFVQERATFVDTGANSIRTLPEIQELMEYQTDLGFSTMTFDEYAKSEYAPVDYAEWLASPVPSASKPAPKSTVVLQQGEDGVWSLPSPE
jgi:hypothetical protein